MFRFCQADQPDPGSESRSVRSWTPSCPCRYPPGQRHCRPISWWRCLGLGRRVGLRLQRDHPLGEFGLVQLAVAVLVIGRELRVDDLRIWLPVAWTWPPAGAASVDVAGCAVCAGSAEVAGAACGAAGVVWAGAGVTCARTGADTIIAAPRKAYFIISSLPTLVRSMTMKTRNASSSLVIRSRSAFCHMGICPSDLKARLVPANGTAHRDSERECTVAVPIPRPEVPHDSALLPCPHDRIWDRRPVSASGSKSRRTPPTRWPSWASCPRKRPRASGKPTRRPGLRHRPHRFDRGRDEARRHRLPDPCRRAHRAGSALPAPGMTSSDVLDTCLAVQLARASDILIEDLDALLAVIKRRAYEHKLTPTIGRSHGIHAEPVTFGLKLAQAYAGSTATAPAWSPRAPTSPPARSRARSAPSPISTPASRRMWRRRWADRRARLDPGHSARSPCDVLCDAGRHRQLESSASRPKSATCSVPRFWKPRNISLRRPEGLVGDAAQAQRC